MKRVGAVILAAGKGTRMRSRLPKVTHRVGGRPMLEHVLRAASEAVAEADDPPQEGGADAEDDSPRFVVVVGHESEQVRASIAWEVPGAPLIYIEQQPQLGTGDAVRQARAALTGGAHPPSTILVLYGDTPLVRAETLSVLLRTHKQTGATLTFLTGEAEDPEGYGRILRDAE